MVEKVITPEPNVVDFARYQSGRNGGSKALAISARAAGIAALRCLTASRKTSAPAPSTSATPNFAGRRAILRGLI